jgi:hypothetical protein
MASAHSTKEAIIGQNHFPNGEFAITVIACNQGLTALLPSQLVPLSVSAYGIEI